MTDSSPDDDGVVRIAEYIDSCRLRVPVFMDQHFSLRGAFRLNRQAWVADLLVAPVNLLAGVPNFLLAVMAMAMEKAGAHRLAQVLQRIHLGMPTRVQNTLHTALMQQLLDLPGTPGQGEDPTRERARLAAGEPVTVYLRTRDTASEVSAGVVAIIAGLLFFSQLTPGSVSVGSALAQSVAREQAISGFFLGDYFGQLYYALFPTQASVALHLLSILTVTLVLSAVSAFSGMLHDPLQWVCGIHRRRLYRLIDAIEEAMHHPGARHGYRPRDSLVGRILDLADWIKSLF